MSAFSDVLDAAQSLPPPEQVRLIEALWDQLSPTEWPVPSDDWMTESRRRSAAYDAGLMSASPWPEVQARTRQKAGLDG
jgi:putative addiction module component (TIGR02574 family)